ncbi:MAG TPA: hypothetical protein VGG25_29125 [Streptosporangiaceae bacterium]
MVLGVAYLACVAAGLMWPGGGRAAGTAPHHRAAHHRAAPGLARPRQHRCLDQPPGPGQAPGSCPAARAREVRS